MLALAALWAPFLAPPARAATVIANLIRVEGRIPITRYATGELVTARQRGELVVNGSLFSQDAVETGADANATLELRDGSRWEVGRNTSFTLGEHDLSALEGPAGKPIERSVDLVAGTLDLTVAPNRRVATVVRTPAGYLTPASTRFAVSVGDSGATEVLILAGEVDFFHPEAGLHISLAAGHEVRLTSRPGELALAILEPSAGPLEEPTAPAAAPLAIELEGRRLTAAAGTALTLSIAPAGDLILEVDDGEVTVTEDGVGTVVQAGDPPVSVGLPEAPPPPPPPAPEPPRENPSPSGG